MMQRTLEGLSFDMPPTASQITELAHVHLKTG